MPKLSHLSGKEVIKALSKAGFRPIRQKESRIILAKQSLEGQKAAVAQNHKKIDIGTPIEIIRQAGMKREEFLSLF